MFLEKKNPVKLFGNTRYKWAPLWEAQYWVATSQVCAVKNPIELGLGQNCPNFLALRSVQGLQLSSAGSEWRYVFTSCGRQRHFFGTPIYPWKRKCFCMETILWNVDLEIEIHCVFVYPAPAFRWYFTPGQGWIARDLMRHIPSIIAPK